jgi:hypothetical protein
MKSFWKPLALFTAALALAASPVATKPAHAQISIGIGIGAEPGCPYGYFDYAPYRCSPYGYYGPDWFRGGRFVGAGPWFQGGRGFYGHVDNRYDPRHGYHGPFPNRGDQQFDHFHGNEARDGHGYYAGPNHDYSHEHGLPGYQGDGGGYHGDHDHGGDHH